MKELNKNYLGQLRKLFAEGTPYESFVESVLQGFQGGTFVDCEMSPSVVQLKLDPFNILGGIQNPMLEGLPLSLRDVAEIVESLQNSLLPWEGQLVLFPQESVGRTIHFGPVLKT